MKIGIRKPNIKSSIKAKTTGKIKRDIKRTVNPLYGKSGMGFINDPKKALYNKIYNKTTIGLNYNIQTKSKKTLDNYNSVVDFVSDIDLDTVSLYDIDEMNFDILEIIYKAYQNTALSKDNKKKLERISSKLLLKDTIPAHLDLNDDVTTKSGKSRHDFPSDFRYLADLDLSTISIEFIENMDIETISAIFHAKNTSWKKKEEKAIWKLIEQRYADEIL